MVPLKLYQWSHSLTQYEGVARGVSGETLTWFCVSVLDIGLIEESDGSIGGKTKYRTRANHTSASHSTSKKGITSDENYVKIRPIHAKQFIDIPDLKSSRRVSYTVVFTLSGHPISPSFLHTGTCYFLLLRSLSSSVHGRNVLLQ